jgi:ABC-2 type transport system permease protein
MNSIYVNSINETKKLFSKKKTVIFLVITALIPIAAAVVLAFAQGKIGINSIISWDFSTSMLGIFTNFFLPLFIFAAAADMFAGEMEDKTIKLILTRPISRFKVYISKNIAIGILIIINLIVILIISTIAGMLAGAKITLFQELKIYTISIVPMLSVSIFASFLAQLFKSSSGVMTACIFIYIACRIVPFLSSKISRLILFNYTDWHLLWLGNTAGANVILSAFMFILSYSIIFFTSGFYLFDRKDI